VEAVVAEGDVPAVGVGQLAAHAVGVEDAGDGADLAAIEVMRLGDGGLGRVVVPGVAVGDLGVLVADLAVVVGDLGQPADAVVGGGDLAGADQARAADAFLGDPLIRCRGGTCTRWNLAPFHVAPSHYRGEIERSSRIVTK
jgi:hypothetical protein